MTFRELYENEKMKPTHAAVFINEMATATHRAEATVRAWIAGTQQPDDLAKSVLSQHLGIAAEILFPTNKN